MDWGGPEFVLAIIAIVTFGSLGRHAIYAKQGLVWNKRKDRAERIAAPVDTGAIDRLTAENARLRADFARLEERTRVLERIVTDSGYSLASQIEALRDAPQTPSSSGVPLDIGKKETV
jgi:hypothetical protein